MWELRSVWTCIIFSTQDSTEPMPTIYSERLTIKCWPIYFQNTINCWTGWQYYTNTLRDGTYFRAHGETELEKTNWFCLFSALSLNTWGSADTQWRKAQELRPVWFEVPMERQPEEAHEGGGECWRGNDWRWLSRIGWHTAAKLLPAPSHVQCNKLCKPRNPRLGTASNCKAHERAIRVPNGRHWQGPLLAACPPLPIITATRPKLHCFAILVKRDFFLRVELSNIKKQGLLEFWRVTVAWCLSG